MAIPPALLHKFFEVVGVDKDSPAASFGSQAVMDEATLAAPGIDEALRDPCSVRGLFGCQSLHMISEMKRDKFVAPARCAD